jgi:lysophospholipase
VGAWLLTIQALLGLHWEDTGQALLVPAAGIRNRGGYHSALPHHPPQVRAFLQPPLKGVVMETFGSGNGPAKPDLLQELRVAAKRGLIIVNCTHCLQGAVTSDYASGMVGVGNRGLGREDTPGG